jgi:hypothetical protein
MRSEIKEFMGWLDRRDAERIPLRLDEEEKVRAPRAH